MCVYQLPLTNLWSDNHHYSWQNQHTRELLSTQETSHKHNNKDPSCLHVTFTCHANNTQHIHQRYILKCSRLITFSSYISSPLQSLPCSSRQDQTAGCGGRCRHWLPLAGVYAATVPQGHWPGYAAFDSHAPTFVSPTPDAHASATLLHSQPADAPATNTIARKNNRLWCEWVWLSSKASAW